MTELLAVSLIRDIPDFPKPGIMFKDITPVLSDAAALAEVIDHLTEFARVIKPDVVVGIESRGFLLGVPVALNLGVGFVPVRKLGKLPSAFNSWLNLRSCLGAYPYRNTPFKPSFGANSYTPQNVMKITPNY